MQVERSCVESLIGIPGFLTLPGYELTLYDSVYKSSCPILILSREISNDYLQALASLIEEIRLRAINLKSSGRFQLASKMWNRKLLRNLLLGSS